MKHRREGPGSLTAIKMFSFLPLRPEFQIPTIKNQCRVEFDWKTAWHLPTGPVVKTILAGFSLKAKGFWKNYLKVTGFFFWLFCCCCLFMIPLLISGGSTLALCRWKPLKQKKKNLQVPRGKVKISNLEASAGWTLEACRLTHWKAPKIYKRWNENMTQWISQRLLLNKPAGFRVNHCSHPWTLTGWKNSIA